MVTYSKSLATIGGCIAASEEMIHYLRHHARSLMFSASLPPAPVGAALMALKIIEDEPERKKFKKFGGDKKVKKVVNF